MNSIKNFFWKNKLAIGACVLTISFGVGYWVLSNPGTTSIGEDITVGNNLYVNGNVGIGTVTPSQKLDVVGNIVASGTVCDSTGCIGGDGSIGAFGVWTNKDSAGDTLVKDTVYKATTDGFVTAYITPAGSAIMYGYTDDIDATTLRFVAASAHAAVGNPKGSITMPVRKDSYWKITNSPDANSIHWLPIGIGVCEKQ